MSSARREHWDSVYGTKAEDAVSWFQENPKPSLDLLDRCEVGSSTSVVDVGGGASRLVDALLARGHRDLTVLDVSEPGLAHARARLDVRVSDVRWLVADVTRWRPNRTFGVWHDRAVLHFLTEVEDRQRYVGVLHAALAGGGLAIVAAFAPDGPNQCSGLPIQRYDADTLQAVVAPQWQRVVTLRQVHRTPWGSEQPFTWLALRRPATERT